MLPLTAILNPSGGDPEPLVNQDGINFPPYEDLDETSRRRAAEFQVQPLGRIRESSRRIPYNTTKRTFFEKTGRTCVEVFEYTYKAVARNQNGVDELQKFRVMWDYKIGLVHTTPFFKSCSYQKTQPSKVIGMNNGLKDICHSITGGSIGAQGYWMPYDCARAVCATFCYSIAGALIPIFGPNFPADCTHPSSPQYKSMRIDPAIIERCTRQAEEFRQIYGEGSSTPTPPGVPGRHTRPPGGAYQVHHPPPAQYLQEYRPRAEYRPVSQYYQGWQTGTDSEAEGSSLDVRHGHHPRLPPLQTHLPTPQLSSGESSYNVSTAQSSPRFSGWTPANRQSQAYHQYGYGSHGSYVQQEREREKERERRQEELRRLQSRHHQQNQPRQQGGSGSRQEPYPTGKRRLQPQADPYRSAVSSSPSYREHFWQPPPGPSLSLQYEVSREVKRTARDVDVDVERDEPRPRPLEAQLEVRHPPPSRRPHAVTRSHHEQNDSLSFDDYDYDYDAGESANGSSPEAPSPQAFQSSRPPLSLSQSQSHARAGHQSRLSESQRQRRGLFSARPEPESLAMSSSGVGVTASRSYGSDSSRDRARDRDRERRAQDSSGKYLELSETDPSSGAQSSSEVRRSGRRGSGSGLRDNPHRQHLFPGLALPSFPPTQPPEGYGYSHSHSDSHSHSGRRSPGPEYSSSGSHSHSGSASRRGSSSSSSAAARGGANINVNTNPKVGSNMAISMHNAGYSLRGAGAGQSTDSPTSPGSFSGSGSGSGSGAGSAETMAAQALLVLGTKDRHRGGDRPQQEQHPHFTDSDSSRETAPSAVHSQAQSRRHSPVHVHGSRHGSPSITVDVTTRFGDEASSRHGHGHGNTFSSFATSVASSPAQKPRERGDTFGRQSPREDQKGMESDDAEVGGTEEQSASRGRDRELDDQSNSIDFAPRRGSRERKRKRRSI
ncbi:hypothetical protein V8F20_009469 [Naviculisporaceae sp. PSN 640]